MTTWEITPMKGRISPVCKLTVCTKTWVREVLRQVSGGIVDIVSGLKTLLETGQALPSEANV